MSALSEKLRKARETKVEAAGFSFVVRRPTDLEMIELRNQPLARAVLPYVIGWEGVSELSMLGTGAPHPLDFDADACSEWLHDRLDILKALVDAVFAAYQDHAKKTEEALKN